MDQQPCQCHDVESDRDCADKTLFYVRLKPYRSLSKQQWYLLMGGVLLGSILVSLPFFLLGAWPIVGFMGLDVLALYWAFNVNFNAARAYEDFHLTAVELQHAKVSAKGKTQKWRFNPLWVRLNREIHAEFGLQKLALCFKDESVQIATFLGVAAKEEFADEFSKALTHARRGVPFNEFHPDTDGHDRRLTHDQLRGDLG